jgi:hypothetical protein
MEISLDEILRISEEKGGELDFMFARQIRPFDIETIIAASYIAYIATYGVRKIKLYILQWGRDNFLWGNAEKRIFVEPITLDGRKHYIAAEPKDVLIKYRGEIGDIYLDVNEISKMIQKTRLEYMNKPLNYLIQEGKVTKIKVNTDKGKVTEKDAVNIMEYWGLTALYYMGIVSKYIFGIYNYEIERFKDKIELANVGKFDISGYKLTFEYNEGNSRFECRIFDASDIFGEVAKRYGIVKNGYIALALFSGLNGYILLEGDPEEEDPKIGRLYKEAKEKTGYDILLLKIDEQKLIKQGIIDERDKKGYVKFIGENKIKKIIDIIRYT